MDYYIHTDIQEILSQKISTLRKKQKITQKRMSEKTGIPLSTYQRIEQLGEGSMRDFAKILVALNRANEINNILNISEETPMEIYERLHNG